MHHTFMHARTPTHNLWLWPKRPPLAFSVAEMSGPKRPRPKLCSHLTDVTLLKGLDEMRSFHIFMHAIICIIPLVVDYVDLE